MGGGGVGRWYDGRAYFLNVGGRKGTSAGG